MSKYKIKVFYGTEMANKAENDESWAKKVVPDGGEIIIEEFNTVAERNAFIKGVDSASGYMETNWFTIDK